MSLECGNAACRKTLTPPFLQCAKCKAAAYCSKECQVPPPAHTCSALRPSTRLRTLTRSSVPAPPRSLSPDRGVEGRAQARVRAGAGRRGGRADPAGRKEGRAPSASEGADQGAEAPGDTVG